MEYGGHLSVSHQSQPSILEVSAQESLGNTLGPAFKHLTKVLSENIPSSWSRVLHYSDELYALLHGVLQWHCLNTHAASFSEHFYGLKRVDISSLPKAISSKSNRNKSSRSRWRALNIFSLHRILRIILPRSNHRTRSLVILVLLPYLQTKISTAYEDNEGMPRHQNKLGRLKQKLLSYWPLIHFSLGIIKFIYYFRYLTGLSRVSTLSHGVSGVTLVRRTESDDVNLSAKAEISSPLLDLFMETLEMGAFFLQFLDWFYSSDQWTSYGTSSEDSISSLPPPPHKIMSDHYGAPKDFTSCPLCKQERVQSTVLTVSGVVFCYSCILIHVKANKNCPVTGYPATLKQLVLIYES